MPGSRPNARCATRQLYLNSLEAVAEADFERSAAPRSPRTPSPTASKRSVYACVLPEPARWSRSSRNSRRRSWRGSPASRSRRPGLKAVAVSDGRYAAPTGPSTMTAAGLSAEPRQTCSDLVRACRRGRFAPCERRMPKLLGAEAAMSMKNRTAPVPFPVQSVLYSSAHADYCLSCGCDESVGASHVRPNSIADTADPPRCAGSPGGACRSPGVDALERVEPSGVPARLRHRGRHTRGSADAI